MRIRGEKENWSHYRLRNGMRVIITRYESRGPWPVMGIVVSSTGEPRWSPDFEGDVTATWSYSGHYIGGREHEMDIVEKIPDAFGRSRLIEAICVLWFLGLLPETHSEVAREWEDALFG